MRSTHVLRTALLAALALQLSCSADREAPLPTQIVSGAETAPLAFHMDDASWSEAVNLGAPVNSPAVEQNPTLSPDQRSLYFVSNRSDLPGAQGANDIWVSRRECRTCPWQTPVNLGSVINTPFGDAGPSLSLDGRFLVFSSNRPDETGSTDNDLYVSRRDDPRDDFGWGPPVKLGSEVNSDLSEFVPHFHQLFGRLYFQRGQSGGHSSNDIFVAPVNWKAEPLGVATAVAEVNDATVADGGPTVRLDGLEMFFNSTRTGRIGSVDIWVSMRRRLSDPWGTPVNVGAPVNIAGAANTGSRDADLSVDGRTLLFMSNRPGSVLNANGAPSEDIWMVTRGWPWR